VIGILDFSRLVTARTWINWYPLLLDGCRNWPKDGKISFLDLWDIWIHQAWITRPSQHRNRHQWNQICPKISNG
jgi:hypothetical protein